MAKVKSVQDAIFAGCAVCSSCGSSSPSTECVSGFARKAVSQMTALSTCQRCTCRYDAAYQKTAASAWFFGQRACCLPKANQRMRARLRTKAETEEVSRFSAVKKQIDGCQRAFGF